MESTLRYPLPCVWCVFGNMLWRKWWLNWLQACPAGLCQRTLDPPVLHLEYCSLWPLYADSLISLKITFFFQRDLSCPAHLSLTIFPQTTLLFSQSSCCFLMFSLFLSPLEYLLHERLSVSAFLMFCSQCLHSFLTQKRYSASMYCIKR